MNFTLLSNLFTRTTYNAQVMIVVPDTNAATAIYEAIKCRTKADVDAHQIQEIPAAEVQTTEETP